MTRGGSAKSIAPSYGEAPIAPVLRRAGAAGFGEKRCDRAYLK
jgi:hypothetical protein